MKDEWNINLVRLAIYSEDYDESQNKIIEDGINYTTELGMYVIVDWHTLMIIIQILIKKRQKNSLLILQISIK